MNKEEFTKGQMFLMGFVAGILFTAIFTLLITGGLYHL